MSFRSLKIKYSLEINLKSAKEKKRLLYLKLQAVTQHRQKSKRLIKIFSKKIKSSTITLSN